MMDKKCCFASREKESNADSLDKLDNVIHSLEMRIGGIDYQCKEHLIRAKNFKTDKIRYEAEILQWKSKKVTYVKYVNLQTNVKRIRDQIDNTSALIDIASQMSIANTVLEEALKNINPEKIDELMDKLQENAEMAEEVNGLLGGGNTIEFDEEKALMELEGVKEVERKPNKQLELEI
jgi:hypothetical protein